jgi:hypothetical protein
MMMADIDAKIESDFKEAEEYAVVFDSVRPIYDFHRTFNLDEFRKQVTTGRSRDSLLDYAL